MQPETLFGEADGPCKCEPYAHNGQDGKLDSLLVVPAEAFVCENERV